MKLFALIIACTASSFAFGPASSFAFGAKGYTCKGAANPNRGFTDDFQVSLAKIEVGSSVILTAQGKDRNLGPVADLLSVNSTDPKDRAGFEATLGFLNEQDVSGIAPADLKTVTRIDAYRVALPNEDEAIVYRLFAGDTQIGGTFMYSGWGSACLAAEFRKALH